MGDEDKLEYRMWMFIKFWIISFWLDVFKIWRYLVKIFIGFLRKIFLVCSCGEEVKMDVGVCVICY